MGGFYDATTQQNAFKAMSQMWQMDQYQQGYAGKDVQASPFVDSHPTQWAYYERRKRNNESARRSREARRQKEDVNCRKLELVQQDNIRLKAELQRVVMELERLKYMAAVQGVQL
ncbi:hypothetical protein Y032_0164g3532 [Ancylostoma ceylanicum]|nr:hypothetical protein Y032_0164g3532 [Ancylostoma ceylanicum]